MRTGNIRWQCTYFDEDRKRQDLELAAVPFKYLLHCTQCGIAPATKVDGDKSYRGVDFDEDTDEKTNVLFGKKKQ